MARRPLPLVALAIVGGCGGAPAVVAPPSEAPAPELGDWHYVVRADPDLATLDVTVCFPGQAPRELYANKRGAAGTVVQAETRTAGRPRRDLPFSGRTISLPEVAVDACVGYVIDVDAIGGWFSTRRNAGSLMIDSAAWLWRPRPAREGASGTVRFELPDGMEHAVCWEPADGPGTYRIDETVFRFIGHSVFGRFTRQQVSVAGAQLDVVRLPGELLLSDAEVELWLSSVGGAVATIHGRFPVPRVQVVLVPTDSRRRESPVLFGNVGRGAGASVMLIVREDATLDAVLDEWVAPHELSHLTMPFVERDDSWLSEGVATYYQEVLRARAGVRTSLDAWRGLDEGFSRGSRGGTGRTLAQESRAMFETFSFQRVYWAGTAIAFLLDVELRKRGGEVASLDEALRRFAQDGGNLRRAWSAADLVRQLDRISGDDVFRDVTERWLGSTDFPAVEEAYRWLGLARDAEGELELVDAPGNAARDAIMASPGG